jgi:hypothetical protein
LVNKRKYNIRNVSNAKIPFPGGFSMAKVKKSTGFWSKLSILLAVGQLLFSLYHEIKQSRKKS